MKKQLLTTAAVLAAGPVLFVGSAVVVGLAQGIHGCMTTGCPVEKQVAPVAKPAPKVAVTVAPKAQIKAQTKAQPKEQPKTVDVTKMSIEEYARYSTNEECKAKGIALGAACTKYHAQEDAKTVAARKAKLDRQAADSYARVNDPAANCSAVLNRCW